MAVGAGRHVRAHAGVDAGAHAGVDVRAGVGVDAGVDGEATAAYAHLFSAVADPTRLAVLQHLASGEHRVRDLVAHLGLAQSTVSKHLAFLLECGLVGVRPAGRSSWYSLADPARLSALVASAEALLESSGKRAVLCGHLRHPRQAAEPEASGRESA